MHCCGDGRVVKYVSFPWCSFTGTSCRPARPLLHLCLLRAAPSPVLALCCQKSRVSWVDAVGGGTAARFPFEMSFVSGAPGPSHGLATIFATKTSTIFSATGVTDPDAIEGPTCTGVRPTTLGCGVALRQRRVFCVVVAVVVGGSVACEVQVPSPLPPTFTGRLGRVLYVVSVAFRKADSTELTTMNLAFKVGTDGHLRLPFLWCAPSATTSVVRTPWLRAGCSVRADGRYLTYQATADCGPVGRPGSRLQDRHDSCEVGGAVPAQVRV